MCLGFGQDSSLGCQYHYLPFTCQTISMSSGRATLTLFSFSSKIIIINMKFTNVQICKLTSYKYVVITVYQKLNFPFVTHAKGFVWLKHREPKAPFPCCTVCSMFEQTCLSISCLVTIYAGQHKYDNVSDILKKLRNILLSSSAPIHHFSKQL